MIVFCCINVFAAEKIVDWKGSESGAKSNPAWVSAINKNDESKIRKFFNISEKDYVFYSIGNGVDESVSLVDAKLNLKSKIAEKLSVQTSNASKSLKLRGIMEEGVFWVKIKNASKTYIKTYYVASVSQNAWEKNKANYIESQKMRNLSMNPDSGNPYPKVFPREDLDDDSELDEEEENLPVKFGKPKITVIDYPGIELGKGIPSWVIAIKTEDSAELENSLPELAGKKRYICTRNGENLEILKSSVKSDAINEVLSEKKLESATSVSGLKLEKDFWIKLKKTDIDEEKPTFYYEYYAVYSIKN